MVLWRAQNLKSANANKYLNTKREINFVLYSIYAVNIVKVWLLLLFSEKIAEIVRIQSNEIV